MHKCGVWESATITIYYCITNMFNIWYFGKLIPNLLQKYIHAQKYFNLIAVIKISV